MSQREVNSISSRLSLRKPQRDSLEILARIGEILRLEKDQDVALSLEIVRSEFPNVHDFERDFPSLCFALATGVGKTRLMGAFIAYLSQVHHLRHFFVLAPTLTIYNKLVVEFSQPNHAKYVFRGLAEFANEPPGVVTGDTYEETNIHAYDLMHGTVINVFNAAKITEGERERGGLRFKRPREVIGPSYYDYLSALDDLVLIMDESHRYRAKGAMKAIGELKPVLGLELTATPKATGSGGADFQNVIYSYPLSEAMRDGFVKEPAAATKQNFRPQDYDEAALELLKLEDGITLHENAKVALETYALQYEKPLVRPFMLVVAQDTHHADELEKLIKGDKFFEGRYAQKVIRVHSNLKGEIAEESVERLLLVEQAHDDRAPEIVIHVNKLGEGWDVANLYTIVPLRRFVADILTEQTLGRGLRLPYGKRTGVDAVDTLSIVAHDKFDQIIREARNPDSIIKKGIVIGRDVPVEKKVAVTVQPRFTPTVQIPGEKPKQDSLVFRTEAEVKVAQIAVEVVKQFEHLPRSADLTKPEVKAQFVKEVRRVLSYGTPKQAALDGIVEAAEEVDVEKIVEQVTAKIIDLTIDIPRIVLQPKGETVIRFADFDLDVAGIYYQPLGQDILIESLSTGRRWTLATGESIAVEDRLENYIVKGLIDKPDVDYSAHSDLLYKLSGQVVGRLRSYLADEDQVVKVLVQHQRQLLELVYAQMRSRQYVAPVEYEVQVSKGFTTLKSTSFDAVATETARHFRNAVDEKLLIKGMSFTGFERCLYPIQKFDSDAERRFSVVLEDDRTVEKWFKPAVGQFRIHLPDGDYEPDFVIETSTAKYLAETKRSSDLTNPDVLAKCEAAVTWCKNATGHEMKEGSGKPWHYLLIPDNGINSTMNLGGLAATYTRK